MKHMTIDGLDSSYSQLIMGSMVFSPDNMVLTSEILDTFVQEGGNIIDTAHIYGGGQSERAIGLWMKERNNRDDIIIIDKGAHPDANGSRVTATDIEHDLNESLRRLQTDYIDIYMLHRDDLNVPIDEIVDILHEHQQAGRIRVAGVSNWTTARIQEANQYAAATGKSSIAVNSPNLSLAKPNEPRWPGCISVDPDYLEWHETSKMPLFSWSSQAGGFFTGRFSPEYTDNAEMVRVYYNSQNWERLRRAQELARQKGKTANQIALAYVLNQPFPTAAIIGPQTKDEFLSSKEALDINLTEAEINWIDVKDA